MYAFYRLCLFSYIYVLSSRWKFISYRLDVVGFYIKLYRININDGARIFKFISELMGLLGCKGFDNIGSTIKLWDIRK